jgi:hypothetical protein
MEVQSIAAAHDTVEGDGAGRQRKAGWPCQMGRDAIIWSSARDRGGFFDVPRTHSKV